MASILNLIRDKSLIWDYYDREDTIGCTLLDNWSCQVKHIEFIEEYLKIGGKEGVLSNFDFALKDFNRAIHTNTVFFLGCLFYKKLKLKNKIHFYRKNKYDEFYFIWFLTSLVHDFGYKVEENKNKFPKITEDIKTISVKNNLLDYEKTTEKHLSQAYNSFKEPTKKIIDYIKTYHEEALQGKRSSKNCKKIDHGIYAGLKLYDALVKNREKRKENEKVENDSLYWGKELEKFYAIASFSIATHNMRREGIDEDIEKLKFSINKEPFLFLFGLIDTLEPTKTFLNCDPKYVLENICITFDENKIKIQNKKDSKLKFENYAKKIKDLEKWIDLTVDCSYSNNITIKIN